MTEDPLVSLAPVRAALIGEATQRADELRAAATADAEAMLAAAGRQVDAVLAQARARGESDGRSAAAAREAISRRDARSVVLTAQRRAYDELRRRVRDAVGALREDPVYPRLLDRLEELARGIAGPAAAITPHPSGGVVAQGAGTFVDCSLLRLADSAVDALGAEVSALWSG
jgi:vacuolar-type H+-ATPase subunit E/Vma4